MRLVRSVRLERNLSKRFGDKSPQKDKACKICRGQGLELQLRMELKESLYEASQREGMDMPDLSV